METFQFESIMGKLDAIAERLDRMIELLSEEEAEESRPKLTAEALQSQIAQLGEQIRNSQQSAQDTKIKFVNSVSTHKYVAAQYVKDWEDKVERTGNMGKSRGVEGNGVCPDMGIPQILGNISTRKPGIQPIKLNGYSSGHVR